MGDGRTILIELLEKAIADFENQNIKKQTLSFDNAEYQAFLSGFHVPADLINISDEMLIKLAQNIEGEDEKQQFLATIKFLKGLLSLKKTQKMELDLNQNQLVTLEALKLLIDETIKKNESLMQSMNDEGTKSSNKYSLLLSLINGDELIKVGDYDLVEELVSKFGPKDNGETLDKTMTYLNSHNAGKLELIQESENKDSAQLELLKAHEGLKNMRDLEKKQNEFMTKINIKIASFIQKSKRKAAAKGLASIEKAQRIKEICAYLGFNYDLLDLTLKAKLLSLRSIDELETFAHYLKDKNPIIMTHLPHNDLRRLVYLLSESNQTIVEKVLHELTYVHNLNDQDLVGVINLATPVFSSQRYENFLANLSLFKEHQASLSVIIGRSSLLLNADCKLIKDALNWLLKYDANPKLVLETCAAVLSHNASVIIRNLNILKMYGFDLKALFAGNESAYMLLNSLALDTKLDSLIEVGLNEYIHNTEGNTANNLRTLIVKRVYYAFKNHLPIWQNPSVNDNKAYNELIDSQKQELDESMISLLIAEHPSLAVIDEGHRPAIYSETPVALLKRKTELLFDNKIISRLKTYRIFKILVDNKVFEKEALLYAISYQAGLETLEFEKIEKAVNGTGVIS